MVRIEISLRTVRRVLVALLALLIAAGFWAEANDNPELLSNRRDRSAWTRFFSLSWEHNLPTWFSSIVLFSCACLLVLNALRSSALRESYTKHWWFLALAFLYISLDEFVQIHEKANAWFQFGGILYFGWVIPAAVIVAIIGISCLGFLRQLPRRTRNRFVLAGSIYVGGALGVEFGLGFWTDTVGSHNAIYGLIDWVEESMEMIGASLFLYSLLDHVAGASGGFELSLDNARESRLAIQANS